MSNLAKWSGRLAVVALSLLTTHVSAESLRDYCDDWKVACNAANVDCSSYSTVDGAFNIDAEVHLLAPVPPYPPPINPLVWANPSAEVSVTNDNPSGTVWARVEYYGSSPGKNVWFGNNTCQGQWLGPCPLAQCVPGSTQACSSTEKICAPGSPECKDECNRDSDCGTGGACKTCAELGIGTCMNFGLACDDAWVCPLGRCEIMGPVSQGGNGQCTCGIECDECPTPDGNPTGCTSEPGFCTGEGAGCNVCKCEAADLPESVLAPQTSLGSNCKLPGCATEECSANCYNAYDPANPWCVTLLPNAGFTLETKFNAFLQALKFEEQSSCWLEDLDERLPVNVTSECCPEN